MTTPEGGGQLVPGRTGLVQHSDHAVFPGGGVGEHLQQGGPVVEVHPGETGVHEEPVGPAPLVRQGGKGALLVIQREAFFGLVACGDAKVKGGRWSAACRSHYGLDQPHKAGPGLRVGACAGA